MSAEMLHGFAYGEHRDGAGGRSLGYRLLAPAGPRPWSAEVEALARRLQAAPYPDHWPPAELFCSVLLATGERLVALARYGLTDHTPSGRRGGLELVGGVGPAGMSVLVARAVYQWLKQRFPAGADVGQMATTFDLSAVLAEANAPPPAAEPVPVLPVKLWQDGVLVFAATTPTEPDQRLALLDQAASGAWQWLPLVGDFPLHDYARRGPLVAWTPHLAGVAVKLDQPPAPMAVPPARPRPVAALAAVGVILLLLAANLWALWDLKHRVAQPVTVAAPATQPAKTEPPPVSAEQPSAEKFALALHRQMLKTGALRDVPQSQLLANYERLAAQDDGWRVSNTEGKLAIGALVHLSRRSPAQVEETVRQALDGKGYDRELVELICRRVYQRLSEAKD